MDYLALAHRLRANEKRRHRKGFRLKVVAGVYLSSVLLFTSVFFFAL